MELIRGLGWQQMEYVAVAPKRINLEVRSDPTS
jgi:hypothetical protein